MHLNASLLLQPRLLNQTATEGVKGVGELRNISYYLDMEPWAGRQRLIRTETDHPEIASHLVQKNELTPRSCQECIERKVLRLFTTSLFTSPKR